MSTQTLRIGELLVREGYLTLDALNKVLDVQKEQKFISKSKKEYKPFGQICVELGLISQSELQRFLKKYNIRVFLGELLINMGLISRQQLTHALEQQKVAQKKLGELLILFNNITEDQLTDALSVQLDIPRIMPSLMLINQSLLDGFDKTYMLDNLFLPMHKDSEGVTVVFYDPLQEEIKKHLESHFGTSVKPALASREKIKETINEYFSIKDEQARKSLEALGKSLESLDLPGEAEIKKPVVIEGLRSGATLAPLEKEIKSDDIVLFGADPMTGQRDQDTAVANFLLTNAMKDRATDIHTEPQESYVRIRYRIDGVLHHKTDLPINLGPSLISKIKKTIGMDPQNNTKLQTSKINGTVNDKKVELESATYPSLWGESMVIHLTDKENDQMDMLMSIERIGFSPLYLQRFQTHLNAPGGLIIVTGPANMGKTTTLYSAINYLNQQNRSIITAEDPVEWRVHGTIQGNYHKDVADSFAEMITGMLAQDPDILMVSEIKDKATLNAVMQAALSGAKVITSYPAFDATGTLLQLTDMGLDKYLVAASNVTVLSQRLIRKLCDHCKTTFEPSMDVFKALGLVDVNPTAYEMYKAVGCEQCNNRGYKGQIAIHEVLHINEAIREAVIDRKPAATIRGIARTEAKLISMAEDGYFKCVEGQTSIDEVQRVAFVNEYDSQIPWEAEEIFEICSGLNPEFL